MNPANLPYLPPSRRSSYGAQATAEESSPRKTVLGIGEGEKPNLYVATTQVKVTGGQLVVSNLGIVDHQESHPHLFFSLRQRKKADCSSALIAGGGFEPPTFEL
jgi:hypothetical protein